MDITTSVCPCAKKTKSKAHSNLKASSTLQVTPTPSIYPCALIQYFCDDPSCGANTSFHVSLTTHSLTYRFV